jgi:hypothetical protein
MTANVYSMLNAHSSVHWLGYHTVHLLCADIDYIEIKQIVRQRVQCILHDIHLTYVQVISQVHHHVVCGPLAV